MPRVRHRNAFTDPRRSQLVASHDRFSNRGKERPVQKTPRRHLVKDHVDRLFATAYCLIIKNDRALEDFRKTHNAALIRSAWSRTSKVPGEHGSDRCSDSTEIWRFHCTR